MQHTLGVQAEAADESALGPPAHMLRGQLSGFGQVHGGPARGLPPLQPPRNTARADSLRLTRPA